MVVPVKGGLIEACRADGDSTSPSNLINNENFRFARLQVQEDYEEKAILRKCTSRLSPLKLPFQSDHFHHLEGQQTCLTVKGVDVVEVISNNCPHNS